MERIGVLTGGGDCPGINAVIRAVAKTAINDYGWEIIGIEDGYLGLIEKRFRRLTYDDVSGILTLGGTILGTSNKTNPFAQPMKIKKRIVFRDFSKHCIENFKKMHLDCLVCIGGDGTLRIAYKFFEKGLPIIGIPKTIDNDVWGTDLTFGFDSAVLTATEAIDKIHTTAQSHHRVMIVEVMGRYAGWLALCSGVAGGGDIILIPEIPFEIEKICARVKERNKKGKRFSIVVVAEGAHPRGGRMVVQRVVKDSPDPLRLGGIGNLLAEEIENRTGIECRVTVLGHLLRGGSPSAFDRILATRFGEYAVKLIKEKDFGEMVALQGREINSISLKEAVSQIKKVPLNHQLLKAALSLGTSLGI
ncbi:MAG: 6-phosphofructokinase [Candidatus Omnitrophica bacterium]|nr:6-phosphofructokinase [Candidatus Omnitrophota bacterium]MCM8794100.1 6-phosphofructokinase [Candidatus Omnitrophota bacterium]